MRLRSQLAGRPRLALKHCSQAYHHTLCSLGPRRALPTGTAAVPVDVIVKTGRFPRIGEPLLPEPCRRAPEPAARVCQVSRDHEADSRRARQQRPPLR